MESNYNLFYVVYMQSTCLLHTLTKLKYMRNLENLTTGIPEPMVVIIYPDLAS